MKDASYFTNLIDSQISDPDLSDRLKPLLHNTFLQVQADAFEHAAGLADEALKDVDVKGPGLLLRATARAIWPGQSQAGSSQSETPPPAA